MNKYLSTHLSRDQKVKLGGYYTPAVLVGVVAEFIKPYLAQHEGAIIIDNAVGGGAFHDLVGGNDYRFADRDKRAYESLQQYLPKDKVFLGNSLLNVSRQMFAVRDDAFVVQVGNPPYNDTTSKDKKGTKGKNICDSDLEDRDMGVSFLKCYDKLRADVVCVLHPLSYLIKKTNFIRLKRFRQNYKLVRGLIFPSSLFDEVGATVFPILAGLYEKNAAGMDFSYIDKFEFSVMGSARPFILNTFETIDDNKYIRKYPRKRKPLKISPIGLYFHPLRDINRLKINAGFLAKSSTNVIIVEQDDFYKYAYLHAFKCNFEPRDMWLYGNLSPLVSKQYLEDHKDLFVAYAMLTSPVLQKLPTEHRDAIANKYQVKVSNWDVTRVTSQVKAHISTLTNDPAVALD